ALLALIGRRQRVVRVAIALRVGGCALAATACAALAAGWRGIVPARFDHADAGVGPHGGAVFAHGAKTDGYALFEVVVEGVHLDLSAGGMAVSVRHREACGR